MEDIIMLEAVERYIRNEMNSDERLHFENLRKTNSDIDQLVVEHTLFLQQMNRFGEWKKIKQDLHGNACASKHRRASHSAGMGNDWGVRDFANHVGHVAILAY